MSKDLIKQLRQNVKELVKIPLPSEPFRPSYDWKEQTIHSPQWSYSVQYISCISLARSLFFKDDEPLYDNISEYSAMTGHSVQLQRDKDRTYVKIKTDREVIEFSQAHEFQKV